AGCRTEALGADIAARPRTVADRRHRADRCGLCPPDALDFTRRLGPAPLREERHVRYDRDALAPEALGSSQREVLGDGRLGDPGVPARPHEQLDARGLVGEALLG